jgi:hypothetical protein
LAALPEPAERADPESDACDERDLPFDELPASEAAAVDFDDDSELPASALTRSRSLDFLPFAPVFSARLSVR